MYFALKQAIELTADEQRAAMKDQDKALGTRIKRDYAPELKVMAQFKAIDKEMRKLYEARNGLASRVNISDDAKKARIKALEEQILRLQTRAVKAYNVALKAHKQAPTK
jgi:hypothetical protein